MFLFDQHDLPINLRTRLTHREVQGGELLYHRGDPATAVFAVERGRLRLFSHTADGQRVTFYVIRPGEFVSEAALFAEAYCGDVLAEIPSRVVVIPKDALLSVLQYHPDLAAQFMHMMAKRFNILRARLELRAIPSARERIMQYVLTMAPPGEKTICLDRPLKSIAEDLGLTHESFYRSLANLVKEGIVCRNKNEISVIKIPNYDLGHTTSSRSAVLMS